MRAEWRSGNGMPRSARYHCPRRQASNAGPGRDPPWLPLFEPFGKALKTVRHPVVAHVFLPRCDPGPGRRPQVPRGLHFRIGSWGVSRVSGTRILRGDHLHRVTEYSVVPGSVA